MSSYPHLMRAISMFLACATLALLTPHQAVAQSGYYNNTQRGWWWGERTVEPQPEEEPPNETRKPEQKKGPWVPPSLKSYKYQDVWNMHPDEFYELQEAYKKKAVQSPTEDNTKDYYELSEIARKKALAFTNASQYVWQKHPELTVAKDYPINTPGNLSRTGNISSERRSLLQQNKDDYALVYFWRPGCSYCDDQKKILKWFESQTNWGVKPVNIMDNPTLAAKVGVEMTPAIIMIKRGQKEHFPISAGVISADEIEDKAYRAVRLMNKEITPEEYSLYEFQRGGGFDTNSRKDWLTTTP